MVDTNETIADIIAEMRGMGNYQRYSGDHARVLAGRLEAAHKRELSKNVSKNGADFGQLGDAAREMRYLASRLLREWQDAVGSNPKFSRYGCMVRRYEKEFNELVREFDKKQLTAIGDAAKLREALEYMFILIDGRHLVLECETTEEISGVQGKLAEARAALSAPPRNCDLARDWMRDLYAHFQPPASVKREMSPEWVDVVMAFCRWLVAPATEQEGGNK